MLAFIFGALPLTFSQTTKSELELEKRRTQEEIKKITELIKATGKVKSTSLGELKALNRKLEDRKRLIGMIEREIGSLNNTISSNDKRIGTLSAELESLKSNYARIVRQAYMNRNQQSTLMLVFSAKDFQQAFKRLYYLKVYSNLRKQQATLILNTQTELSDRRNRLETDLSTKRVLLGSEVKEKKQLSSEKFEQERTISELKKKESKLRKDLAKKESDSKKLSREIQRIIEREIKKERERAIAKLNREKPKEKPVKPGKPATEAPEKPIAEFKVTPETKAISGKFESNKGRLPWPVEKGVITETFGAHAHPVLKNISTLNNGIDIATQNGAAVRAIFEGEVSGVIAIPGANMAVIIKHGEYLTVYSNLVSVSVTKGQRVKTGQSIGVAGMDEADSKTEAHLEIWKGKTKLNPSEWIAR